jgi:hypothetical protein
MTTGPLIFLKLSQSSICILKLYHHSIPDNHRKNCARYIFLELPGLGKVSKILKDLLS